MKKLVALVLAAVMLLSLTSVFADAAEEKVITLWSIATESDANRPAYEAAIAAVEAAHPGLKIEMEATENQTYKTKIKTAMSDPSTLPDIFFTWAGAFCGDFAAQNNVYCLNDAYKAFADQLPEVMLQNASYGENKDHYAVPLTMNIVALFANMDLLAKAGWEEIPATYEDMIKCCDDLLAAGITPFGCAGTETWCVTEYLEPIIEKTIGYEKLNAIFAGEETWNNPDIAKAVDIFQEMVTKGYFAADGLTLGNDQIKANFIAGNYAFYQNGTWNAGEINDAGKNFKVALFPVIDGEKATYSQVIGGPSDSLAVAATSKDPEFAAQIAFELGKEICHYGYLKGSGLPAWTPDYDTSEVKPMVVTVSEMVAAADGMVLFGDTAMSADPANIYLDYVSKVYGCEIDGQQFIDGLAATLQ
jgi:raffinose/stachyose/melibiose transport system substrate-binding protein